MDQPYCLFTFHTSWKSFFCISCLDSISSRKPILTLSPALISKVSLLCVPMVLITKSYLLVYVSASSAYNKTHKGRK